MTFAEERRTVLDSFLTVDRNLRAFARARGIKCYCQAKTPGFLWNGRTIRIDRRPGSRAWAEDLSHELGHYLTTPLARRFLPEWGTGPSYQWTRKQAAEVVKPTALDESDASLMGVALYAWAGATADDVRLYLWDHAWEREGMTRKSWRKLQRRHELPPELHALRDGAWIRAAFRTA